MLTKQGKPFTNSKLIKSCLFVAAKGMCPEEISFLKTISLLVTIVAGRVEGVGSDSNNQLKNKTNDWSGFPWLWMSQQMLQILLSCLFEELMQR